MKSDRWFHSPVLKDIASAVGLGLVLGGMVHMIAILILPSYSKNSAYYRVVKVASAYTTVLISPASPLEDEPYNDPQMVRSACHYDLTQGPVRVLLPVSGTLVQSISIQSERGGVQYAVSDRAAANSALSLLLLTPQDYDTLQAQDDEEETVRDVRIPLPLTKGFVLARVIFPLSSLKEKAEDTASQLSCTVEKLP